MKFKTIINLTTFELAVRIWVALYVCIYGIGKMNQFKNANLSDLPLSEISKPEMMWAFFGTTITYPLIIGSLQVLGAILLIFNRTKLIAAIILTPIFLNIILLDILYEIDKGALLNAVIYQVVFIFLIIQQREKITRIFNLALVKNENDLTWDENLMKALIGLSLAIGMFIGFQFLSGMY